MNEKREKGSTNPVYSRLRDGFLRRGKTTRDRRMERVKKRYRESRRTLKHTSMCEWEGYGGDLTTSDLETSNGTMATDRNHLSVIYKKN